MATSTIDLIGPYLPAAGELALWLAVLMCAWTATLSFSGGSMRRPDLVIWGRRGMYVSGGLVLIAALALWTALATSDFSIRYVASLTSANLPLIYKLAALWGGISGATLFCCLILAFWAALSVFSNRAIDRELMPWVTGTTALVLLFLIATTVVASEPFARLEWVPLDGRGLDPLLQDPAMLLHPPLLYLGYLSTVIPFGYVVAALITRKLDADWLVSVRAWSLVSWACLTLGILTGVWWAYLEPAWQGSWVWTPVENGSILPWFTLTLLLHPMMIEMRARTLRMWNVTLVVATSLLSVLGTLIIRSGVAESVRSFAQGSAAAWLVILSAAVLIAALWLARECFAHAESDTEAALIGQVLRQGGDMRPRIGGYVAYAGLAIMLAALAGATFKLETAVSLAEGESYRATDPYGREWTFTNDGISRFLTLNREVSAVSLRPSMGERAFPILTGERRLYYDSRGNPTFKPSTEVGLLSLASQDIRLDVVEARRSSADMRISFNPLAKWLWPGGLLLVFGGILACWPRTARATPTDHPVR